MSVRRMFHWSCNHCSTEVVAAAHGFPRDWRWFLVNGETGHACERCAENMRAEGYGVSKMDPLQLTNMPGQFITS